MLFQEGRDDGRCPYQHDDGDHRVAAGDIDKAIGEHIDNAGFGQATNNDKQASEKADGRRFNVEQNFLLPLRG